MLFFYFMYQEKFIRGIGGRDLKSAVKNSLIKIMADELAKEFNWSGEVRQDRPQKKPFGDTEIQKTLFSTLSVYNLTKQINYFPLPIPDAIKSMEKFGANKNTDHDIKCADTKWLSGAPERFKRATEALARRQARR